MSGTSDALVFLLLRSTRNRFGRQLARLRRPRYALGMALGLGYLWLVFVRPSGPPPEASSGMTAIAGAIATVLLAGTVLWWWVFGAPDGALAFQPAEVQLLFPAPLSRRALLAYRIGRSQVPLLVSCVIWTLLVRRWGVSLPGPLRFVSVWALLTLLGLHRLALGLVGTVPVRGGRRVAREAVRVAGIVVALALASAVAQPLLSVGALGWGATFRSVAAALESAPVSWAIAPARLALAPLYATSAAAWARAFALVLVLLAAHVVWVLSMDVEFEESAALASAEVARRITAASERRAGGTPAPKAGKATRTWLPLAPTGHPAVAIAWKNTLALSRTGALRTWLTSLVMIVIVWKIVAGQEGGRAAAAAAFGMFAVMSVAFGPRLLRNDLRMDLLKLAALKTLPLSGGALVAAEIACPVLLLTALQVLVGGFAYATLVAGSSAAPARVVVAGVLVVAPFTLLALNAANVGVQNAAAVLFPSWVRLGSDSGGIEAMGQNLLVSLGSILVLALSLLFPGLIGALVFWASRTALGPLAVPAACAVATLSLSLEVVMLVASVGGALERMDPSALT